MKCRITPSGQHYFPPVQGQAQQCVYCGQWRINTRPKVVHLPPPAVLAELAPARKDDAGTGNLLPFSRVEGF